MITPKLTAVIVAMTALMGAGPVAAFAQDDESTNNEAETSIGGELDQFNAANVEVETGRNTIVQSQDQDANNDVTISNEAESESEASASGDDSENSAESESEASAFQLLN